MSKNSDTSPKDSTGAPLSDARLPDPPRDDAVTYGKYLLVDQLLELQVPHSDPEEHDEMLFIVIHQVYELWFKLLLHEFAKVGKDLINGDVFWALATLKRCRNVLKVLVSQLDVLETMTPMSFNSFRARLDQASGFQSHQFREFEFRLGHKREALIKFQPEGSESRAKLEAAFQEPTLVDALYRFLDGRGIEVPKELLERDVTQKIEANPVVQKGLLEAYRNQPDISLLIEALTDIDEGLQEWRYRHVKMVERTIGNKMGTGGSSGASYLRSTLFAPLFPDLWAIRGGL